MVSDASGTGRPGGRLSDTFDDAAAPPGATGAGAVAARVREVVAFAGYYVAAQLDRFKLTAINVAMFAVLGVIAGAIGLAVVFTSAVLLVLGIAHAIGALLGGRMWAGELITAAVVLGGLTAGVVVAFKIVTGSTRGKLKAAYDQRKRDQRESFGTDVHAEAR